MRRPRERSEHHCHGPLAKSKNLQGDWACGPIYNTWTRGFCNQTREEIRGRRLRKGGTCKLNLRVVMLGGVESSLVPTTSGRPPRLTNAFTAHGKARDRAAIALVRYLSQLAANARREETIIHASPTGAMVNKRANIVDRRGGQETPCCAVRAVYRF
jgi:hypothetical protein